MDLKFEVVVVPVSDVDRAKKFYEEALGFRVDVDYRAAAYEEALGVRQRGQRAIASCSGRRRDRNARSRSVRGSRR